MINPNSGPLEVIVHRNSSDNIPDHHVVRSGRGAGSGLISYFTNSSSSTIQSQSGKWRSRSSSRNRNGTDQSKNDTRIGSKPQRIAFQNPWPSSVKITSKQIWDALEWGEDLDPSIDLAISHLTGTNDVSSSTSTQPISGKMSRAQAISELLRVGQPDFDFDHANSQAKTTWLGHAGILIQLPPLKSGGRPIRCIFDPIFSNRCSPSQAAGPIRTYQPPCKIEALPPVDIYVISHDHYDHLDYNTVTALWKLNKEWIRFVVPLGNKQYFVDSGISEDRITELDWWESVDLSQSGSPSMKISCTPAQHRSGGGMTTNQTLWASWYLEYPRPKSYRIYFAGDTGFQFHASPTWPPKPTIIDGRVKLEKETYEEKNPSPSCPAFQDIADRLGTPDLLLLPVAVGASYSYMRSYIPLPDSISPVPRHHPGVTGANHMPPWDSVRVLRLMTEKSDQTKDRQPMAVAMHWGTFVPERTEVLKTLGQLEYACFQQDVSFGRSLEDIKDKSLQPMFIALNHGESVTT